MRALLITFKLRLSEFESSLVSHCSARATTEQEREREATCYQVIATIMIRAGENEGVKGQRTYVQSVGDLTPEQLHLSDPRGRA
jgi:hypothetical protein